MFGQHFASDFNVLTDQQPLAWQERLDVRLAAGDPPDGIDIPTRPGKTMVLVLKLRRCDVSREIAEGDE